VADFGSPIAQNVNVNPQQGIQTLSGLLQLKQRQVGLQQQQQELQTQTAQAYQAQQSATERQNLANINWKPFFDDGDIEGAQKTAMAVAPTTGAEFSGRLAEAMGNGLKVKSAAAQLNQQYLEPYRNALSLWGADPNADIADLGNQLDAVREGVPASARPKVDAMVNGTLTSLSHPNLLTGAPKSLEEQKQAALAFSRAGLPQPDVSGTGGLATPAIGTAVGPGGTMVGTTQSRTLGTTAAAPGSGISLGLSPAQLAQTITLPNKQVTTLGAFLGKSLGGSGPSAPTAPKPPAAPAPGGTQPMPFYKANGAPRTAQDDAPPANAPGAVQDQYSAASGQAGKYVQTIRDADEQYGNNIAISNSIRRLAANTSTGPGTQMWHSVLGAIGAPAELNNVSDYQQLGAWLDRQAAGTRGVMGLPATNEGQATSQSIAGNTSYQPEAIQAKNDYNQALVEGLHQQRNGLDKITGYSPTPSPVSVAAFRGAWSSNFDPTVYELENAKKRLQEDPNAVTKVVQQLTPEQAKDLQAKRPKLRQLSAGQPPQ
jgi:hypothetical protein